MENPVQIQSSTRTSSINGRFSIAMFEYRRAHVNGKVMSLTGCFFRSITCSVKPIYLYIYIHEIDPKNLANPKSIGNKHPLWRVLSWFLQQDTGTSDDKVANPTINLHFGGWFLPQSMALFGMVWNWICLISHFIGESYGLLYSVFWSILFANKRCYLSYPCGTLQLGKTGSWFCANQRLLGLDAQADSSLLDVEHWPPGYGWINCVMVNGGGVCLLIGRWASHCTI